MEAAEAATGQEPEYLLLREVEGALRASRDTVRRLIYSGELRAIRWNNTFRIERESFDDFLARSAERATRSKRRVAGTR